MQIQSDDHTHQKKLKDYNVHDAIYECRDIILGGARICVPNKKRSHHIS